MISLKEEKVIYEFDGDAYNRVEVNNLTREKCEELYKQNKNVKKYYVNNATLEHWLNYFLPIDIENNYYRVFVFND